MKTVKKGRYFEFDGFAWKVLIDESDMGAMISIQALARRLRRKPENVARALGCLREIEGEGWAGDYDILLMLARCGRRDADVLIQELTAWVGSARMDAWQIVMQDVGRTRAELRVMTDKAQGMISELHRRNSAPLFSDMSDAGMEFDADDRPN